MTLAMTALSPSELTLTSRTSLRLAPAAPGRWRVVESTGRIIGHLDALPHPGGARYRARRYHAPTRAFRDIGDFWSPDDAVDALRFTR
jgi:hypothetical protein